MPYIQTRTTCKIDKEKENSKWRIKEYGTEYGYYSKYLEEELSNNSKEALRQSW